MSSLHARADAVTAQIVRLGRAAPVHARPVFASIAVRAGLTEGAHERVADAIQLARVFEARLVGVGCPAEPGDRVGDRVGSAPAVSCALEREAVAAAFRDLAGATRFPWDWRWSDGAPLAALLGSAQAELIVEDREPDPGEGHRPMDLARLVSLCGAPVLVRTERPLRRFARLVVLCDGGPSARRAATAALPFLTRADHVELWASDPAAASEMATRLRRRQVPVSAQVRPIGSRGPRPEALLTSRTDLVVAGVAPSVWRWRRAAGLRALLRLPAPLLVSA